MEEGEGRVGRRVGEREREKEREEGAEALAEAPAPGLESLEDHCHCPAMHIALVASEARDQGVRGLFSFQQVWVLCLVHVPSMG